VKGDFSRWRYKRSDNFFGVLPQQGRVLLDSDGTAQTSIVSDWQDVTAIDVIGAGVAAVPAELADSFKIDRARVQAGQVLVTVEPGRVWADGVLVHLVENSPVDRVATYLEPPVQTPQASVAMIGAGVRDAVVLEVWREAINGFQLPDVLIEPALGGPDTAERVYTSAAFRLYRMGAGDTCSSIPIADDFSKKGKLEVTLQPTIPSGGDCPVIEGGGYTGFEHHLYRIEIADLPAGGAPSFKWSRFNGGLVGRGIFDGATLRVNLTANLAAINTCGLSQFYLEAEEFDVLRGVWSVTYGAPVTLNSSNQLVLPAVATFGAIPSSPPPPADPRTVFFRLWDGIKPISAFVAAKELEDGIILQFDPAAAANYSARDYWTFQVRAGGVGNPLTLIDTKPPQGIVHHRVPLGVITWNAALDVTAAAGGISDCRDPFQPLTRISSCCTYRVGDGIESHGEFKTIQAAVNALPASGGEICVLPGTYRESVFINGRRDIRMHGCGPRSRIIAPLQRNTALPGIHVRDSRGICIDSLAVEAQPLGPGILLDNTGSDAAVLLPGGQIPKLHDIELLRLRVTAQARSAIEARGGRFIEIRECDIRMLDVPSGWPGIFFLGDDGLIERNQVRVRSRRQLDDDITWPVPASSGLGGIQIGGTSDRVRIINNIIQGGIANGITLGSVMVVDANGNDGGILIGWVVNANDPCNPCNPGSTFFPPGSSQDPTRTVSAGPLTEIRIERNRIYDMGLSGISVVAFFDLKSAQETISVARLAILGNDIRRCLRREIESIPAAMIERIGYGGIALADVESLDIWDNVIEDNGPRRTDPICGIFVLLGEGVDISRNRIVNNGARTEEPVSSAKRGQRGGIIIRNVTSPVSGAATTKLTAYTAIQTDRPALRVHDNIVVTPMGRALSVTALGAVSAVGNQFVSQAVTPIQTRSTDAFLASTVYIGNLGRNFDIRSWQASYQKTKLGAFQQDNNYSFSNNTFSAAPTAIAPTTVRFFIGGQVLFVANQVMLDVTERGVSIAASSIMIVSLDDVGFSDNQCQMQLADDVVIVHALLFGISLRANGNRWEEPVPNALYSAITLGMMNVTAHNVGTHCIAALAPPKLLVAGPNVVLLSQFFDDPCSVVNKILAGFGAVIGG